VSAMTFSNAVLLVDDDEAVLTVLEALLKRGGLQVHLARSVGQALAVLAHESIGLVLVDKNLPDQSGLELIPEARRLQPDVACVLMTAYPTYESTLLAMRMGASDYLEKPFKDLQLVLTRIQNVLEQQQVVFERNALARLVKDMRTSLKERDALLVKQQHALRDLEGRVAEKVKGLEAQVKVLQSELQSAQSQLEIVEEPGTEPGD
jgi:DNA-binding NtrC family response regulator